MTTKVAVSADNIQRFVVFAEDTHMHILVLVCQYEVVLRKDKEQVRQGVLSWVGSLRRNQWIQVKDFC